MSSTLTESPGEAERSRVSFVQGVRRLVARARTLWDEPDLTDLHGPDRSVSPFETVVTLRAIVFLVFAAACVWFGLWSDDRRVGLIFVLVAIAQPIAALAFRRRSSLLLSHICTDVVVAIVVSSVDEDFVYAALMCLMALGVANMMSMPIPRAVPIAVVTLVGIMITATVGGASYVERIGLAALIVLAYYAQIGYRSRDAIRRSRRDLQSAIHAAGGLTHTSDVQTLSFELGGDIQPLLGFTNEQWVATPPPEMVHPDDLISMAVDPSEIVEGQILDRTARFLHKDGHWVWIRDVSRVVMHHGRPFLRGMLIDVTAERVGLKEMTDMASTDQLTGLANRRALLEDLQALEPVNGHALVLMDLNRFKEINDTMGHDAGDQLLREVAARLQAGVQATDRLCRLGGDEFAVVMTGVSDIASVIEAVDRLAMDVARPIELNGVGLTVSLSAGIVASSTGNSEAITMLRHADLAMYAAKRTSCRSVVFDVTLEQQLEDRLELTRALPSALADGSLALQYQPIADCSTGEIVGAEGLARWNHPALGMLAPASFLDVLLLSERSGEFSRAMVSDALRTYRRLADAGFAIRIAVNIPVPIFEDVAFEAWFVEERTRLDAHDARLEFELAEGGPHRSDVMERAIERFRALGVSVSIDDFGTGNATFERLQWRGIEHLKIDGDMVTAASASARDKSILASVTELALGLDYTITAEGVETLEQFDLVRRLGVTQVQGWLFEQAMPTDDLLALLVGGGFRKHPAIARTATRRS